MDEVFEFFFSTVSRTRLKSGFTKEMLQRLITCKQYKSFVSIKLITSYEIFIISLHLYYTILVYLYIYEISIEIDLLI
jgi:hypothetical protein